MATQDKLFKTGIEAFEDRHAGYEFPSEDLRTGALNEFLAGRRSTPEAALVRTLIEVCSAAIPVSNSAHNTGQHHAQWALIKRHLDALDKARNDAHELIRDIQG